MSKRTRRRHPVQVLDPTPTLTASPVPTVSPYFGWTEEEVEMLACAIYQEAGGDAAATCAAIVWAMSS